VFAVEWIGVAMMGAAATILAVLGAIGWYFKPPKK
jgi:hypothetical protein